MKKVPPQFADKRSCFKVIRQNEQNTTFAFKALQVFGFLREEAVELARLIENASIIKLTSF